MKITANGETTIWPTAKLHDTRYGAIAHAMEA